MADDQGEARWQRRGRLALVVLLVAAGILHFVAPAPYVRIMPRALPGRWFEPLVYLSGAAELAGGAALVPRRTRRGAGWFVMVLLVLLFPANVQMAVDSPNAATILRLPLQVPLIWLAWRQTVGAPTVRAAPPPRP